MDYVKIRPKGSHHEGHEGSQRKPSSRKPSWYFASFVVPAFEFPIEADGW